LKFDEEEFIHVLLIVYHERGREGEERDISTVDEKNEEGVLLID